MKIEFENGSTIDTNNLITPEQWRDYLDNNIMDMINANTIDVEYEEVESTLLK